MKENHPFSAGSFTTCLDISHSVGLPHLKISGRCREPFVHRDVESMFRCKVNKSVSLDTNISDSKHKHLFYLKSVDVC